MAKTMRTSFSCLMVAAFCAAASSAALSADPTPVRDRLEGIPLVWKPTTRPSELGPVDTTGLSRVKLQVGPCTDARADPALIGQNREQAKVRKVSTPSDVPTFVANQMRQLIAATGIATVQSDPTHILKCEVTQFMVDETSKYKSDVRFDVTLTDGAGKALWSGSASGAATRFGRSYKADNYYETLSDGLLEATYSLLKNPSFREALAK